MVSIDHLELPPSSYPDFWTPPSLVPNPRSPAAPPWIEASLCAGALGLRAPNRVPKTPRAAAPAPPARFPAALFPLAGLMFFWSRCSSVTVLVSQ